MKTQILRPSAQLTPYVTSIMVMESDKKNAVTRLPFYADGYPGILFAQTQNDLVLEPHHKVLDEFILYGQTITPIELCLKGAFRLIVFILYPFVLKKLFDIQPATITDTCTDLSTKTNPLFTRLKKTKTSDRQVRLIDDHLCYLVSQRQPEVNPVVSQAIAHIVAAKGAKSIKSIRESLHVTERTFERLFISHIGISPKRFAQIVQFQSCVAQLTREQQLRLSDIVYENGFADQSHFIRMFRKFSGQTPGQFKK